MEGALPEGDSLSTYLSTLQPVKAYPRAPATRKEKMILGIGYLLLAHCSIQSAPIPGT